MPEFSHPFQGNKCDRTLTKEELIRAIRFSIASEFEAIQLYEQLKDSINDEKCKKILEEVADDERVHVGNFQFILEQLSPKDKSAIKEGFEEAKKIISEG